jgi:predicted outer membrane repeat protein
MRRFLSIWLALGLVLSFSLLTAVPAMAFTQVWVDDDALNDPGPGDNTISDPAEDGSQDHPFDEIQEAIDYVALDPEGGIVNVLEGTYYEYHIDTMNGVDVLGAGADVTIIDGGGTNGPVVRAGSSVGSGTVFDGFTITNGLASYGGGMHISGSELTVSNCIFLNNEAANDGGGMYIYSTCSPLVVNCVFQDNEAGETGGAIRCRSNPNPTIANNIIIYNEVTHPVLGIGGGGIYVDSTSHPTIINNTIANNTVVVSGMTIGGGGIYAANSSSTIITNNIIVNNSAPAGGGIYASGTSPTIDYNDVFSNTGGNYGGTATAGLHDINPPSGEDPLFEDPGPPEYDYHLQVGSPCIDVGDNAAVATAGLTTDFEGDPRVSDGNGDSTDTVDMGADEYYVAPPPPPPSPPSSSRSVGGEVHPIDKAALLLPWLGLSMALILAAGGLILIRRRAS